MLDRATESVVAHSRRGVVGYCCPPNLSMAGQVGQVGPHNLDGYKWSPNGASAPVGTLYISIYLCIVWHCVATRLSSEISSLAALSKLDGRLSSDGHYYCYYYYYYCSYFSFCFCVCCLESLIQSVISRSPFLLSSYYWTAECNKFASPISKTLNTAQSHPKNAVALNYSGFQTIEHSFVSPVPVNFGRPTILPPLICLSVCPSVLQSFLKRAPLESQNISSK